MMKKLLILVAVLVFSTATMAGTVSVVVEPDGPYTPSQIVTVTVVGDGYLSPAQGGTQMTVIGNMVIDSLTSTHLGAEGVGTLHPALAVGITDTGDLVNVVPDLITGILGGIQMGGALPDDGTALYTYEFHVPQVPDSTIITLGIDGIVLKNAFNQPLTVDSVTPAEIHVIPEPMTIALLGLGGLFLRRRK